MWEAYTCSVCGRLVLLSADTFSDLQPTLMCVFCVFQVDKLQQADAERAEEMQDQQPPPMMSEWVVCYLPVLQAAWEVVMSSTSRRIVCMYLLAAIIISFLSLFSSSQPTCLWWLRLVLAWSESLPQELWYLQEWCPGHPLPSPHSNLAFMANTSRVYRTLA